MITGAVDEHGLTEAWEAEWRRAIVKECMAQVRTEVQKTTMQAFELFALEEWPADKVAEHLGLTRNAVYQAKSHVLARMRALHKQLKESW